MNFEVYRISKSWEKFLGLRISCDTLKECISLGNARSLKTSYFKTLNSNIYCREIVAKAKFGKRENCVIVCSQKSIFIVTFDFQTIVKINKSNAHLYSLCLRFIGIFIRRGDFDFLKIGEKKSFYMRFFDRSTHNDLKINTNIL